MINTIVALKDIRYVEKDPGDLLASVAIRGIAIPVQVNVTDEGYECVDGHRRCTACKILAEQNEKFLRVPVMILNDYSKAGSGFWGNTRNHH